MEQLHFLQPLPLYHTPHYVSVFAGTEEHRTEHGLYLMLPHQCQTKEESLLQSACSIPATNPRGSWPSLVLQDSHAKLSCRQLTPAYTAAWCYPGSDARLGLHKLPVLSPLQPVPLPSSPVLHGVRHSPAFCREVHMPVEPAGPCSPQHSDH